MKAGSQEKRRVREAGEAYVQSTVKGFLALMSFATKFLARHLLQWVCQFFSGAKELRKSVVLAGD